MKNLTSSDVEFLLWLRGQSDAVIQALIDVTDLIKADRLPAGDLPALQKYFDDLVWLHEQSDFQTDGSFELSWSAA